MTTMKRLNSLVVLAIVATIFALGMSLRAQQRPTVQWAMKDCFTLNDVTNFLNALPPDRAADAKVLAINSQRSFLGAMDTPYYVWYRR